MDFAHDARTTELIERLTDFMDTRVHPAEATFAAQVAESDDRWAWSRVPCSRSCRPRRASAACGTCSCRPSTTRTAAARA